MAIVRFNWSGDAVRKKIVQSAKYGVNKTMSESVVYAKQNHPGWQNQTGLAEGSIRIHTEATESGASIRGIWGSVMGGDRNKHNYVWDLEFERGGFLRNSSIANYPNLPKYMRERFNR